MRKAPTQAAWPQSETKGNVSSSRDDSSVDLEDATPNVDRLWIVAAQPESTSHVSRRLLIGLATEREYGSGKWKMY